MSFEKLIEELNAEYRDTRRTLAVCESVNLEHPTAQTREQVLLARGQLNGLKIAIEKAKKNQVQELPLPRRERR